MATTNQNQKSDGNSANSGAASGRTTTPSGGGNNTAPPQHYTAVPNKLSFIKDKVVSQDYELGKAMVDFSSAMLTRSKEIMKRVKAVKKYGDNIDANNEAFDKITDDAMDLNLFIPNSVRKIKHPLTHSKQAEDSPRLTDVRAAIKAVEEKGRIAHEHYIKYMAVQCGNIAKLELEGERVLLKHELINYMAFVAETLVDNFTINHEYQPKLTIEHLAQVVIRQFINAVDDEFWTNVLILADVNDEAKKNVYKFLEESLGFNYERDIKPNYDDKNGTGSSKHPDADLVLSVYNEYKDLIPTTTSKLFKWATQTKKKQKTNANTKVRVNKFKTDRANEEVEEATEDSPEQTMRTFIRTEISSEYTRRASKRKNEARKNSSDDAEESQASTSTENGQKSKSKSKKKGKKTGGKSKKRSNESSDDDSHSSRQERHARSNNDRAHQTVRRHNSPRGILKRDSERRFVTWERPRSRSRTRRRSNSPYPRGQGRGGRGGRYYHDDRNRGGYNNDSRGGRDRNWTR